MVADPKACGLRIGQRNPAPWRVGWDARFWAPATSTVGSGIGGARRSVVAPAEQVRDQRVSDQEQDRSKGGEDQENWYDL